MNRLNKRYIFAQFKLTVSFNRHLHYYSKNEKDYYRGCRSGSIGRL